VNFCNLN